MNDKHEEFMRLALDEARESLKKNLLPVGAVLVVDGEVVGRAHKDENHSYHLDHAEVILLREFFKGKNIKRDHSVVALYTTLEPCMMCMGTILHLPVNEVVYACPDLYGGGSKILNSNELPVRHKKHPINIISGVLEREVRGIFGDFMMKGTSQFYSKENVDNPFILYCLENKV